MTDLRLWIINAVRWGVLLGAAIGVCFYPPTWGRLGVLLVSYVVGMLFVTVGYHRYFSHRAFKTGRLFQFLLAVGCCTTLQRGVIWWSAVHRHHHRYSDTAADLHSPRDGFRWAHVGWLKSPAALNMPLSSVKDLLSFPELRVLEKTYYLVALAFAGLLWAIGGGAAVVWGFLIRTVLCWQATYAVNSLAHRFGYRRFDTRDDSRNNVFLGIVGMGEGWHNNHHRYPASARNGFYRWEVDIAWWAIRALAAVGLVWDVITVPPRIMEEGKQIHSEPSVDGVAS